MVSDNEDSALSSGRDEKPRYLHASEGDSEGVCGIERGREGAAQKRKSTVNRELVAQKVGARRMRGAALEGGVVQGIGGGGGEMTLLDRKAREGDGLGVFAVPAESAFRSAVTRREEWFELSERRRRSPNNRTREG